MSKRNNNTLSNSTKAISILSRPVEYYDHSL